VDSVVDELEMSRRMDTRLGRANAYDETLAKLSKIKKLKENIDNDEFELKREHLMLMHERNIYMEKLLMIRQLCQESHGDHELVSSLKPLIEDFTARLKKAAGKPMKTT
jgi:hypothetical protein